MPHQLKLEKKRKQMEEEDAEEENKTTVVCYLSSTVGCFYHLIEAVRRQGLGNDQIITQAINV